MNYATGLLVLCLFVPTAPSLAKDTSKVAYVAGTLPLARFTTGRFDSTDERECVFVWADGKQQTRLPYPRVVFAEAGSYSPRNTLGPFGLDDRVLYFLTLIYRDDANRTQIMELELLGRSNGLSELIQSRAPVPLHTTPAEVTALAPSLVSSIGATTLETRIWSTTMQPVPAGAKATLRMTSEGMEFQAGRKQIRVGYAAIQSLELGQKIGSRAVTGILLSALTLNELPMFLMKKRVRHLLTVSFMDNGAVQALVIEIPKYSSRALMLELELRSGKRVEVEPAKAGGGIYG